VAAGDWREFAGSSDFLGPLAARLAELRIAPAPLLEPATADPGWKGLAALDAAVRLCAALRRAGGVRPGDEARRVVQSLWSAAIAEPSEAASVIPPGYWFAHELEGDPERLQLRGAIVVRVLGRRAEGETPPPESLSPELAAALKEPPSRPWRTLVALLREDGWLAPAVLGAL
jgi:ATP-binding cassette subfamily B protein